MLVENSNRRTFPVDRHAGAAVAGVAADGRAVINTAVSEAARYKNFYGDAIPGHVLAERLATHVHLYNLYWRVLLPLGGVLPVGVGRSGAGGWQAWHCLAGGASPLLCWC